MSKRSKHYRNHHEGYALASVLFLVTILSLVALSILLLIYSRRQLALREVAKVKADYAAQNAISLLLNDWKGPGHIAAQQHYDFEDGTSANATLSAWGFLALVQATGRSARFSETRTAIIGSVPGEVFKNALVFTHPSHQLVFAGASKVIGTVRTGPQGVSTGSLPGAISPRTVPIEGRLINDANLLTRLVAEQAIDEWNSCLEKTTQSSPTLHLGDASGLADVPDSVSVVRVPAGSIIRAEVMRRRSPIYVFADGDLTIAGEAQLRGLIAFMAARNLSVQRGSKLEHVVLCAGVSISVNAAADITAQCIAPEVTIADGAALRYPSVVGSYSTDPDRESKGVRIGAGCRIEGTILVAGRFAADEQRARLTLAPGSVVIGAIINEMATDLRSRVRGTLLTRDFFFYESPTSYLGWLRDGQIDRPSLPEGFLIPTVVGDHKGFQVLDWL